MWGWGRWIENCGAASARWVGGGPAAVESQSRSQVEVLVGAWETPIARTRGSWLLLLTMRACPLRPAHSLCQLASVARCLHYQGVARRQPRTDRQTPLKKNPSPIPSSAVRGGGHPFWTVPGGCLFWHAKQSSKSVSRFWPRPPSGDATAAARLRWASMMIPVCPGNGSCGNGASTVATRMETGAGSGAVQYCAVLGSCLAS